MEWTSVDHRVLESNVGPSVQQLTLGPNWVMMQQDIDPKHSGLRIPRVKQRLWGMFIICFSIFAMWQPVRQIINVQSVDFIFFNTDVAKNIVAVATSPQLKRISKKNQRFVWSRVICCTACLNNT